MSITDESIMPFGKHKGEKMANIPSSYLLWLYNSGNCFFEMKKYIKDNMDVILQDIKNSKQSKP